MQTVRRGSRAEKKELHRRGRKADGSGRHSCGKTINPAREPRRAVTAAGLLPVAREGLLPPRWAAADHAGGRRIIP